MKRRFSNSAAARSPSTCLTVPHWFSGASDWPLGSGHTIEANAVIGKYTFFGDVDLDGQVTPGDYGILDANLGSGSGSPLSPAGVSAVPEPASIASLATTALMFGSRRRRRV